MSGLQLALTLYLTKIHADLSRRLVSIGNCSDIVLGGEIVVVFLY